MRMMILLATKCSQFTLHWQVNSESLLGSLPALMALPASPGLVPSQPSLRDPVLAVQFIPLLLQKKRFLFSTGLRLLYVSNVTAASFSSQVWRPCDKTDTA